MKQYLLALCIFAGSSALSSDTISVAVHADRVRYTMAGGIGASWHAESQDSIDADPGYRWVNRTPNSRGSAWGGNPPPTMSSAWEQMYRYASWLGLSFVRVELSARMYEPERNVYDWDNAEMKALYRILDWAEANNADVFLQQMWSNVKWNAYPGVQPLLSAPKSIPDFADGIATLVDHLVRARKYSCIRYVCIANEPPGGPGWGSWWTAGETDPPITPALKAVREALDRKGLSITLSGPDWTDLPAFDSAKIDFDQYIGAYDIHSYQGVDSVRQNILESWVTWAAQKGKPLFLSELGDMRLGWGESNPGPKSFAASLSNAETILRGLRAGVSAFNRWSFTNRGDLDGQWQLIRTWDREKKIYFDSVGVEPAAFYGYGIITRFVAKHSSVVTTEESENEDIFCQATKTPDGLLTILMLNKGASSRVVRLGIEGAVGARLFLYSVSEEEVMEPGFRMEPVKEFVVTEGEDVLLTLGGRSISTLTGFRTMHEAAARHR
jgi:hypothetical protein